MSAIAPKTGIDSLFREPSMRGRVRRAAHDCITGDGPVVLIYGCSECNWIYRPQTPEEASEKYLLIAQFNFEQHACSKYAAGS